MPVIPGLEIKGCIADPVTKKGKEQKPSGEETVSGRAVANAVRKETTPGCCRGGWAQVLPQPGDGLI